MTPGAVKCPICRKPVVWDGNPDRPFCSNRCRMVDLGAWASEEYAVPGEKLPDEKYSD
ncbi:DNA gyrase inhibitor YacG [Geobacter pelophilus]|uniref:DNA gyrase inhibitor YacG n=1 Tax=Geoanaerobacter pelophilus TaxID=60036 RepID=A0AAW4L8C7_9BACT|nr:DNA gyrase inhibitor YacG [Geoanaerobacter pelophilus]MBT0665802.1 DNA gyrase inhibitor YacG [Geoanaerobacter pelophilus]